MLIGLHMGSLSELNTHRMFQYGGVDIAPDNPSELEASDICHIIFHFASIVIEHIDAPIGLSGSTKL